jgi:TPR repeat protein
MYLVGTGVTKDYTRAAGLFDQSCKSGVNDACTFLGVAYDEGMGVSRDAKRAAALYKQACTAGSNLACERQRKLKAL